MSTEAAALIKRLTKQESALNKCWELSIEAQIEIDNEGRDFADVREKLVAIAEAAAFALCKGENT